MDTIHTLDAVTFRQTPSDGSPFTYYPQSCMLSHAGRLYHQTKDGILDHNAGYRASVDVYVITTKLGISINVRRIYLITYDYTEGFAYFNYVQSSTSGRIVYVMHAVQRLQRFWRSVLAWRLMRKCEVLLLHALCIPRAQQPTWLQRLPVDILLLIQEEARISLPVA